MQFKKEAKRQEALPVMSLVDDAISSDEEDLKKRRSQKIIKLLMQ